MLAIPGRSVSDNSFKDNASLPGSTNLLLLDYFCSHGGRVYNASAVIYYYKVRTIASILLIQVPAGLPGYCIQARRIPHDIINLSQRHGAPVTFTTEGTNLVFQIPQSLAITVASYITVSICPSPTPALGKRQLDAALNCVVSNAENAMFNVDSLAKHDPHLEAIMVAFPANFHSLMGEFAQAVNQMATYVHQKPIFNRPGYTGGVIHAIIAIFLGISYLHSQNPTDSIAINTLPLSDYTGASAIVATSSGCSSLTVTQTYPTTTTSMIVSHHQIPFTTKAHTSLSTATTQVAKA